MSYILNLLVMTIRNQHEQSNERIYAQTITFHSFQLVWNTTWRYKVL